MFRVIKFSVGIIMFSLIISTTIAGQTTASLKGQIIDKSSGMGVPGAALIIESLKKGSAANSDGNFKIDFLTPGSYKVKVSALSYKSVEITDVILKSGLNELNVVIEEDVNLLNEVVVTSVKRMNSELAVIQASRQADAVVSGISSRTISKSQDRSAAEVVKRIPGVSVINDRYIMVRGLASRYNNVWVNNASVPGTEADSRSFSFDMIPGSQIESIMIVKSPSAELPSDFAGGFVKITTKSMPEENEMSINYGMNLNSSTHFHNHFYNTSSPTDFLGFDNGVRSIKSFVGSRLNNNDAEAVTRATKEGFRNNWNVYDQKPMPDQRVNFSISRLLKLKNSAKLAMTGALNYSYSYQTFSNMMNSRYGVYNNIADQPEFIYYYIDNQYSVDAKVGAMLNFTYLKGKNKLEFRNIFNQIGKNRYTTRSGWQNLSQRYDQEKYEYLYNSRTTYTGQFTGAHSYNNIQIDWNAGYSFAQLNQPDRRIINREENQIVGDANYGQMGIDQNEITRDFVKLNEHTITPSVDIKIPFTLSGIQTELKTGLYGEFRTREYKNRQFFYRFNQYNFPSDFVYGDVLQDILKESNFGSNKLYIYEDTDNRDSYSAKNMLAAAYLSYKINTGKFNIIAGIRSEARRVVVTSYTSIYENITSDKVYDNIDLHPSVNASYNLDKKNLLRVALGTASNNQEFRELSSSVFYDFNLFSDVKGNTSLKRAKIYNLDLRYEYYPSNEEYMTFALFYKHFTNPIEQTYIDAGGSYTYTFENAKQANNYGIEADIRKNLTFIGLKNFTIGLNAAIISSKVKFDRSTSLERDRAMQGQSPYLVNTSLFYDAPRKGLSLGILYNRIGERLVGIGRVDTSSGASMNNDVPDTYELPRDVLDIVINKKIGKSLEIKFSGKDLLNQSVIFKQYPRFVDSDGVIQERSQISRNFKPGVSIYLGVQYTF